MKATYNSIETPAPTFDDLQRKAMEAGCLLSAVDTLLQDADQRGGEIWDAIWVVRNCKKIVDELNDALDSASIGKAIAATEASHA